MRGPETRLPPAFSLLKSEFNDFLYAPIGTERNDTVLTVLSAFARLGIDPWQEAARLGRLSSAAATRRLTSIIAGLPNGRWTQSDADGIATRLVGLLPATGGAALPLPGTASRARGVSPRTVMFLVVAFLVCFLLFSIVNRLRTTAEVNADDPLPSTTTAPRVPSAGSK